MTSFFRIESLRSILSGAAMTILLAVSVDANAGLLGIQSRAAFDLAIGGWSTTSTSFESTPVNTSFGAGSGPGGSGFVLTLSGPSAPALMATVSDQFWTTSGTITRRKIMQKVPCRTVALVSALVCLQPLPAAAQIEPFIGQIMCAGFNFAPRGWAELNGQLLPINQNQPCSPFWEPNTGATVRPRSHCPICRAALCFMQARERALQLAIREN